MDTARRPETVSTESITAFLATRSWDRAGLLDRVIQPERPALQAWARGNGALVVAGQQPAIGGGPLYTLVKTAQAVALARRLSTSATPVLPCFWNASDDHDLTEADHADIIRADGRIARYRVDLGHPRALRHVLARTGWDGLIAHLHQQLGPGVGSEWLQAHAPRTDEDLGAWLERLLIALFPDLLTVAAWRLRPLWREQLRHAAAAWPQAAMATQRAAVLAAGGRDALGDLADPPCFLDTPEGRVGLDHGALAAQLATDPDAISPGAALRPILQQAALPAALVVLGPGERAYHALIQPLYGALALPPPLQVPRSSITLMPTWWQRGVRAWGNDPLTLRADDRPQRRHGDGEELAALDHALADLAAQPFTGTAAVTRDAGVKRLRHERDRLARSLENVRRHNAGRTSWGDLVAWAFPRGGPQDRTLSLAAAIWSHGPTLAESLVAACAAGDQGSDLRVPC